MPSLTDLTQLKQKVERLKSEADKATGALNQSLKRLEAEFQCKSLEEAEQLLKKLQKSEAAAAEAFETALADFEEKWANELD